MGKMKTCQTRGVASDQKEKKKRKTLCEGPTITDLQEKSVVGSLI